MDMEQKKGRASILFEHPPVIKSVGTVSGTREGQGPLGRFFDSVEPDDKMGMENWEEAESAMQEKAAGLALKKGKLTEQEMDYSFAGDLLGQLIATSFGSGSLHVPLFGLYGACSTMGEALGLGAMTVNAGYGKNVLAMASSHFATAEKEFRFPLAYGNQRPKSATWTVTGCGAAVIGKHGEKGIAQIAGITTGQVVDAGGQRLYEHGCCHGTGGLSYGNAEFKRSGDHKRAAGRWLVRQDHYRGSGKNWKTSIGRSFTE